MNIYQKLIEVRKSVPYLQKETKGFQYNYVSSSQVLMAIKETMDKHGLLVMPSIKQTEVATSEGTNKRGEPTTKYFTEAWLEYTIINAEKPEEHIVIPWYAQGLDVEGEKGVGKLLTYGEKYLFLKLFNIATDKDDPDSFQDTPKEEPTRHNVVDTRQRTKTFTDEKDDEKLDWTSFWLETKKLGLNPNSVHSEAQPYFNHNASLQTVPGLTNKMLTDFLVHLKGLVKS